MSVVSEVICVRSDTVSAELDIGVSREDEPGVLDGGAGVPW